MSDPDRYDLEEVKQRAKVRLLWPVGKIGSDQAWCRYCNALIPGEWAADRWRTPHTEGCPVPEAMGRADNDVNDLVAEVERLSQEGADLRAMLGRDGKDAGRMWHDRAQHVKADRDAARAEAEDLRGRLQAHLRMLERAAGSPDGGKAWLAAEVDRLRGQAGP